MNRKTIAEIRSMLTSQRIEDDDLKLLRQDVRKGVQHLLNIYDRKKRKKEELLNVQEMKRQFDRQFKKNNKTLLAGVDEAGRGPLAGPMTAAAVILPEDFLLPGLTDSKQVTEATRHVFYETIRNEAIAYHIAIIEPEVIDNINIYEATKRAMQEALYALTPRPAIALIDAVNLAEQVITIKAMTNGDNKSQVIAAASILAKVKRDEIMEELDQAFPAYEFAKNKGYGTKKHLEALKRYGPTPYHRRSFAPVSNLLVSGEEGQWI